MSWKLEGSKGRWTPEGCRRTGGDNWSSICACNHFSSFAITMATREVRPRVFRPRRFTFSPRPAVELGRDRRDVTRVTSRVMSLQGNESHALWVVSCVGLSVSLLCLFLTIVTFVLCRSLWSVSISLHLQLSICLFIADLLFLVAEHLTTKMVMAPWGLLRHLGVSLSILGSPWAPQDLLEHLGVFEGSLMSP